MTLQEIVDNTRTSADLFRLTLQHVEHKAYRTEEARHSCAIGVLSFYAANARDAASARIASDAMLLVGFQLSKPILAVLSDAIERVESRAA